MARSNGLGFNFNLKGQDYVFSLLGNLQTRNSAFVREVIGAVPDIVDKVAVAYFRSKSHNKNHSSFERTAITVPWQPSKYKTVKVETWSDKLWDYKTSYKKDWVVSKQTVNVSFNPENAIVQWYLEGTRPHWIYPKNKKFLMFYWEKADDLVVFKKVYHPGAKKHPRAYSTIQNRSLKKITEFVAKKRNEYMIGLSPLERNVRMYGNFSSRRGL